MYESLTKYLSDFSQNEFGTWVVDKVNNGTLDHPIHLPYVNYSQKVSNFIHDVHVFVEDHKSMDLYNYQDILESNGIYFNENSFHSITVENLHAQCVLALILSAVRAERFCEGALLGCLEDGLIQRCLFRLKELDRQEK